MRFYCIRILYLLGYHIIIRRSGKKSRTIDFEIHKKYKTFKNPKNPADDKINKNLVKNCNLMDDI